MPLLCTHWSGRTGRTSSDRRIEIPGTVGGIPEDKSKAVLIAHEVGHNLFGTEDQTWKGGHNPDRKSIMRDTDRFGALTLEDKFNALEACLLMTRFTVLGSKVTLCTAYPGQCCGSRQGATTRPGTESRSTGGVTPSPSGPTTPGPSQPPRRDEAFHRMEMF